MTEARQVITPADVLRSQMREIMHGHGDRGMYVYEYRCVQYPRVTKLVRRESRKVAEVTTFSVDGAEVESTAEAIADALNKPHDLAGIADRFNARSFRTVAQLIGGILVVTGETAARCVRLRESYPHFEGVPIDWKATAPTEGDAA